jgi:hypothetical protein
MDEIQAFLEKTGFSSYDDSGWTVVSLFGVSESKTHDANVDVANRIVGQSVFSFTKEVSFLVVYRINSGFINKSAFVAFKNGYD